MKTIVSVQEISEVEIKPREAVAEWRALVASEIATRWAARADWIRIDCPACGNPESLPAFEKCGLAYAECIACGTLHAPHRPSEIELCAWYRESAPARYWRERLLPAGEQTRGEKIVVPRANWVLDGMAEYAPAARRLVDLSPDGRALLDLVAESAHGLTDLLAASATADLDGASGPRVWVRPATTADLPSLGPADVVIAVDVLDRAADLRALAAALERTLVHGGVLFATAPVASGFEIQTLWDRSPTVLPPDKLNLPTVDGLLRLFAAPAWEVLELSTPGMFDVETVHRAIAADPGANWPRAVRALVERDDPAGRSAFVEFLQSRRLTSFARIVARRKS
jgi:SAM-dependent methyltransferase